MRARVAVEEARPVDLKRETDGELSLVPDYRLAAAPTGPVKLGMAGGGREARYVIGGRLTASPGSRGKPAVPLHCFGDAGADMDEVTIAMLLETAETSHLDVSQVRLHYGPPGTTMTCPKQ